MINQSLIDFIKQSLQSGLDKKTITKQLLENGWTGQDIEEGFKTVDSPASISASEAHSNKKIFLVIVTLFLIAGGIFAYYVKDKFINFPATKSASLGKTMTVTGTSTTLSAQYGDSTSTKQDQTQTKLIPLTTAVSKSQNSMGTLDCGIDMNCFIKASQTCALATVETNTTVDLFGLLETSKSNLSLKGTVSGGKCSFVSRVDDVSLAFDSATLAAAKAQGATNAKIQEQLQQSTSLAKQSIGIVTTCSFTTVSLTRMLTNRQKGNFSSSDLAPENCSTTFPPGGSRTETTTINLSAFVPELTNNGINFKVNGDITNSQLNVTITDTKTKQSQTVIFTLNNPVTVLGHTMTLTEIKQINISSAGEQPNYTEQASLTY